MRKIWKAVLEVNKPMPQLFSLPIGSKPISVGPDPRQAGDARFVAVWFEVETESSMGEFYLSVVGTDHELPDGQFLGTVVIYPYAWHIFKVLK